jgi:hypothetical protein
MSRENTIERIKKLLELAANNPSEAEATAAALAAQRLIAQHDVRDEELMQTAEEVIAEIESGNFKGNPWAIMLAHAIVDNFRCRMYLTANGYRNWYSGRMCKTDQRVVFMGRETDATAATETFNRLFEIGNKLAAREAREQLRLYGTARGVKNSFLLGYVDGIKGELEAQCMALALFCPKEVSDYADERTSNMASTTSHIRNGGDGYSYGRGKVAGRDTMRAGSISD